MRQRLLLDNNWRFHLGHAADAGKDFEFTRSRCLVKAGEARGAAGGVFDDSTWPIVAIPHDWAIELPLDPNGDKELCEHGFYSVGPDHPEHSVGWYRRAFTLPNSDLGRRISVEFDGVFRDSIVWINGHRLGRHASGYTSFRHDLTDYINYGAKNTLAVRVDVSSWEGWWYEGAGIYRHVWLTKTDPLHVAPNGVVVTSRLAKSAAAVSVQTTVVNESGAKAKFMLLSAIHDPNGKKVGSARSRPINLIAGQSIDLAQKIIVRNPALWSCDHPNLYQLRTTLLRNHRPVDSIHTPFGIRTLRWDAKRGFFLNGRSLKIQGTCNHQQHGGLGIALPDRIQEIRIQKLKQLGSNAYRCSHYAATPELLDACDRYGLLVIAENRLAGSSPEVLGQFESMIRRDRNHPSIIAWSIANEEHTVQWSIAGERIGKTMLNLAHRLDPTRAVTAAMHDKGLNVGFANIVDIHGWNYLEMGDIEAFHARRPDQPIVGTEEGSTVCTRGIYADDPKRGYLSAYDLRSPKWGSTAEHWWTFFAHRPWIAGGFVWTGFDYYGEPIPYKWPCTASHFGLMDLCGFPKDNYYYYKSWWSRQTTLHLFPHWNWPGKENQPIDVRCFSNCDEIELFLNGSSLGRRAMPQNSHLAWHVPYRPGRIEAVGYIAGKIAARAANQTTAPASKLALIADRPVIFADGEDLAQIAVSVTDSHGRIVPTSDAKISFHLDGPARLLGVANGDPSNHDSPKASHSRLFNGLCMVIVQASNKPGTINIRATSPGLTADSLSIPTKPTPGLKHRWHDFGSSSHG